MCWMIIYALDSEWYIASFDEIMNKTALDTSRPKFKLSKYMIFFPLMLMTIKCQCVFMSFNGR